MTALRTLTTFFLTVQLLSVVGSCKSTQSSRLKSESMNIDEPLLLDPEKEGVEFPEYLWSPSRRRSQATYLFLVAEYAKLDSRIPLAEKLYTLADRLDPNPLLGGRALTMKAALHGPTATLEGSRKLTLKYPFSADLKFLNGQILSRLGSEDAEKQLLSAISIEPQNENYYFELISYFESKEKLLKAAETAERLVKNIPQSLIGWVYLTKHYLTDKKYDLALKSAENAYDLESNQPEIVLLYAMSLEYKGQSDKARAYYDEIFRLTDGDEFVSGRLLLVYKELGRLEDSLKMISNLIASTEKPSPALRAQKALILWELERPEEASAVLSEIAADFPDSTKMQYLFGLSLERVKEFDRARTIYSTIPSHDSLYPHAVLRIGLMDIENKEFKLAEQVLKKLEDRKDNHVMYYSIFSSVYGELKDYKRAVAVVDKGLELFSTDENLLFYKGVYEERQGRLKESIEAMENALKHHPESSKILNFLGYSYADLGENLERAERLLIKALSLKPEDPFYMDSLAWCFFRLGKLAAAEELLKKASVLEPNEAVIYAHLASVYDAMGESDKAKEFFEKAFSFEQFDEREKKLAEERFQIFLKQRGSQDSNR